MTRQPTESEWTPACPHGLHPNDCSRCRPARAEGALDRLTTWLCVTALGVEYKHVEYVGTKGVVVRVRLRARKVDPLAADIWEGDGLDIAAAIHAALDAAGAPAAGADTNEKAGAP